MDKQALRTVSDRFETCRNARSRPIMIPDEAAGQEHGQRGVGAKEEASQRFRIAFRTPAATLTVPAFSRAVPALTGAVR